MKKESEKDTLTTSRVIQVSWEKSSCSLPKKVASYRNTRVTINTRNFLSEEERRSIIISFSKD